MSLRVRKHQLPRLFLCCESCDAVGVVARGFFGLEPGDLVAALPLEQDSVRARHRRLFCEIFCICQQVFFLVLESMNGLLCRLAFLRHLCTIGHQVVGDHLIISHQGLNL